MESPSSFPFFHLSPRRTGVRLVPKCRKNRNLPDSSASSRGEGGNVALASLFVTPAYEPGFLNKSPLLLLQPLSYNSRMWKANLAGIIAFIMCMYIFMPMLGPVLCRDGWASPLSEYKEHVPATAALTEVDGDGQLWSAYS